VSLESKAKTYEEVYALWKEAWAKTVDGVYNPLLDQKWVRLEDAQELEKQVVEINRTANEILQKKQQLESRLEKLKISLTGLLNSLPVQTCSSYVACEKCKKYLEEALKLVKC